MRHADEHAADLVRPRTEPIGPGHIRVAAPAKINLTLQVGPMRADGYHHVDSIVARITFYDELELLARGDGRIAFRCRGADCGPEEKNLAFRAARLLQDRFGGAGAEIDLSKRIPPGAGLGGGSSDAAAVLEGLNELWRLGLSPEQLRQAGAELGSDVPLFLGPVCSRVSGRGEIVTAADVHDFWAVLIVPDAHCSTPLVYRAYDDAPHPIGGQVRPSLLSSQPPSKWRELLRNDLAEPAARVSDEFARAREALVSGLPVPVHVSGSGSAMFVLCDDLREARELIARVPADPAPRSRIVRKNPW